MNQGATSDMSEMSEMGDSPTWALFYELLGIDASNGQPDAYELLGMKREGFDAHRVGALLEARKQQLRSKLTTPRLLPLMIVFEERLDQAARVLADPKARAGYDQALASGAAAQPVRTEAQEREEQRLREIVERVKQILESALNQDRTLDNARRPIVAYRMRELGIRVEDIDDLLRRIPAPIGSMQTGPVFGQPAPVARTRPVLEDEPSIWQSRGLQTVFAMMVVLSFVLVLLVTSLMQKDARKSNAQVDKEVAATASQDTVPLTHELLQTGLADQLVDSAATRAEVAARLSGADDAALRGALLRLLGDSPPTGAGVTGFFRVSGGVLDVEAVVLSWATLEITGEAQKALVDALFGVIAEGATSDASSSLSSSSPNSSSSRRAGALLATLLLLEGPADEPLHGRTDWTPLGERWRAVWSASVDRRPSDPLHDPQRLLSSITRGRGALHRYALWSDGPRFARLTSALARQAAWADGSEAVRALSALETQARAGNTSPLWARAAAVQALIDVIRQTQSEPLAERCLRTVVDTTKLSGAAESQLKGMPLKSAFDRSVAADQLAGAVGGAQDVARGGQRTPGLPPHQSVSRLEEMRVARATTNTDADQLGVSALAMFTARAQLARVTSSGDVWEAALRRTFDSRDPARQLTRRIELLATAQDAAAELEALERDMKSDHLGRRYAAIEKLVEMDTYAAITILLEGLERPAHWPTLYRIVRASPRLHDVRVHRQLLELLAQTSREAIAANITQALWKGVVFKEARDPFDVFADDDPVIDPRRALLGPRHSRDERQACARYWRSTLAKTRWNWGVEDNQRTKRRSHADGEVWQPDVETHQRLAALSFYIQSIADQLEQLGWNERGDALEGNARRYVEPRTGGPGYGTALSAACEAMLTQVRKLTQGHPSVSTGASGASGGAVHANRIDMLILERDARWLASRSRLQQCAVDLDITGRLLEILIELAMPDAQLTALHRARQQRDAALGMRRGGGHEVDVIVEIETLAVYHAILWNIVGEGLDLEEH